MRLIDADKLKKCYEGHNESTAKADYLSICKMIDSQPTAYDVDKVIKGLDKAKPISVDAGFGTIYKTIRKDVAIDIVKQGGVNDNVCMWRE